MRKLIFAFIFIQLGCASNRYFETANLTNIREEKIFIETTQEFVLVVRTAAGCGVCVYGLKAIQERINCDKIKVLVIDEGTKEQVELQYADFSEYDYVLASQLPKNKLDVKLFPQFFLYNTTGNLVWKGNGYNKLDTSKILSLSGC